MIGVVSRSRAALTALSLIPVLLVAGCSDDEPKPKFAPPSSESPSSPSTSPTAPTGLTPPEIPSAAKERSPAGARAFVRHWIAIVNLAQRTGETSGVVALNDVRCSGCRGIIKAIDSVYQAGGYIEGGDISAGRLRELPLDFGAEWAGYAEAQTEAQTVVSANGAHEDHAGAPFDLYAYIDWNDGWRMRWLRTPS